MAEYFKRLSEHLEQNKFKLNIGKGKLGIGK